ncbi:MAG: hypothetical protein VYD19_11590 [Myxococcota bacterium]|nr:hypothetical protein [Myxococcota bacterium]
MSETDQSAQPSVDLGRDRSAVVDRRVSSMEDAAPLDRAPSDLGEDHGSEDRGGAPIDRAPATDFSPVETDPEQGIPTFTTTVVVSGSGKSWLVWGEGPRLWRRVINSAGRFQGPGEIIATLSESEVESEGGLDQGTERTDRGADAGALEDSGVIDDLGTRGGERVISFVRGVLVGETPWIAYGDATGPAQLLTADFPNEEQSRHVLPLSGPVSLTALDGRLFVVGDTPTAGLAWLFVTEEGLGELLADPLGLGRPDAVGALGGNALLRYEEPGQCVHIDRTGALIGNAPCISATGEFFGDAQRPFLSYHRLSSRESRLKVVSLFKTDDDLAYNVLTLDGDEVLNFQNDGGSRALVGLPSRQASESVDRRLLILSAAGLRQSQESWPRWPFPNARAVIDRGNEALVVRFREEAPPLLERISMGENLFADGQPFEIDLDPRCRPTLERCDWIDQDCDELIDDGLCCASGDFDNSHEFVLNRDSDVPFQLFVSDVENLDAARLAIRVAEDQWQVWFLLYRNQFRLSSQLLYKGLIRGAHEGFGFVSAGGRSALIARDSEGSWTAFWHYDGLPSERKEPEPLRCERPLALDVVGDTPSSTSPVLICSDRLIQLRSDRNPDTRAFEENREIPGLHDSIEEIEWATITRHGGGQSSTVYGYRASDDNRWLVRKTFLAFGAEETISARGRDVLTPPLNLSQGDSVFPIYAHQSALAINPPLLQLREGEGRILPHLLLPFENGYRWQQVITGGSVEDARYARLLKKLVTVGPVAERETGFWVIDLSDTLGERVNLWSTTPAFTWSGPRPYWALLQGNYSNYILILGEVDGIPNRWRVATRQVTRCEF